MDTYPTVHGKFGKSSTQNAHFWGNMLVPWRLPHKPYMSKREAISNDRKVNLNIGSVTRKIPSQKYESHFYHHLRSTNFWAIRTSSHTSLHSFSPPPGFVHPNTNTKKNWHSSCGLGALFGVREILGGEITPFSGSISEIPAGMCVL